MADVLGFLGDIAFPTAMARMRQREAQQQAQQILGQQGQQYQQGMGQGMLQNIPGTGLLGGQTTPIQAGTQLLGVPGYEQAGLNLISQFAPKPASPQPYKTVELGAGGGMKQQFAYDPMNPQNMIPMGQPYSTGTGLDKPIGSGAANWLNNQGENPPATMTISQATAAGYFPKTTQELNVMQAAKGFSPILGQAIKYGFGSPDKQGKYQNSIFPPSEGIAGNLLVRAGTGLLASAGAKGGFNEQAALYNSATDAMVSNLARIGGQTGVLTEPDVQRVRSLIPQPGFTPLPQAKKQFAMIVELLRSKGMSDAMIKKSGIPDWAFNSTEQSGQTTSPGGWSITPVQ